MALTIKNLFAAQLGTGANTTLYTVPTGKAAIVKNLRCVNRDTSQRTFNLYMKTAAGTAQLITPQNMVLPAGGLAVEENEVTLAAGDQIQGDASVASKVDCVISGIERDA
jgi:hypothetical protein